MLYWYKIALNTKKPKICNNLILRRDGALFCALLYVHKSAYEWFRSYVLMAIKSIPVTSSGKSRGGCQGMIVTYEMQILLAGAAH